MRLPTQWLCHVTFNDGTVSTGMYDRLEIHYLNEAVLDGKYFSITIIKNMGVES